MYYNILRAIRKYLHKLKSPIMCVYRQLEANNDKFYIQTPKKMKIIATSLTGPNQTSGKANYLKTKSS